MLRLTRHRVSVAGTEQGWDALPKSPTKRGAPLVMVRNRSCPAVSHICSFTHLFSSNTFFILKSMLHAPRTLSSAVRPRTLKSPQQLQRCRAQRTPDCGNEAGRERVLREAQQQAALPNACSASPSPQRLPTRDFLRAVRKSPGTVDSTEAPRSIPLSPIRSSFMR